MASLVGTALQVPVSFSIRSRSPCCAVSCFQTARPRHRLIARATGEGEDISDALKADLERFKAKSQQASNGNSPAPMQEAASPFSSVKETIDKVLIADFFLVLFALAWLGLGVVLANTSGTGSSPVLDAWYPLWPTLWQSAIGLLMAGALVSGGLGWLASKRNDSN